MEHKGLKIVFISDTHGQHRSLKIPECDVLVHAGDYTVVGACEEIVDFYHWLMEQTQAKHKVFIEGNHELMADNGPLVRKFKDTVKYEEFIEYLHSMAGAFKDENIHRLHDSEVIIDGIKFWGSPNTVAFYHWAFNMNMEELHDHWEKIPYDVDVLITHGPPLGKLDRTVSGQRVGDAHLLMKILELTAKVHVFGHIHEGAGTITLGDIDGQEGMLCINASVVDENYKLRDDGPFILTLPPSTRV